MTQHPPFHALARAARLAIALPSLAAATATWAQTAPTVERIEVSAQRRLEPLQDVPAAVSALSAAQLEVRGVTTTQDFVAAIPNMSFDQSFTYLNSFVVLRGVTQINNADSPVAIVVDGVPQNNQKQFRMNLVDIERIEVLKGPQGALYGRNALGGAVNIVTKAPAASFGGFAGVSFASGSDVTVNAAVSGPLAAGTSFRLTAQDRRSDGLIRNDFLGRTVDGIDHDSLVRAKLAIDAGRDVTVDINAGWNDFRAGANHDSIVPGGDVTKVVNPVPNQFGKTFGRIGDASVKVDLGTRLGTLSSITAFTDLQESYRGDLDFSNPRDLPGGFLGLGFQAGQGQELKVRMTSQELRLTSPDSGPVRYIAGLYALRTDRQVRTRAFVDIDSTFGQIDNPAQVIVNLSEKNRNTATAVFGQVDVDVAANTTLSAALRHDRDARRQTNLADGSEREISFSRTQPKLTLNHRLDKDALAYATVSTGFRSGGLNAPGLPGFRAETLTNFEVGSKNTLLGGAMVLNVALFEARSRDFQYFYVDVARASQLIGNIDRVRIRGLDFDLRWRASRSLTVDAGLGITEGRIQQNAAQPDTVGNHTPKNTPHKATLGVQHDQALGSGRVTLRADLEHRSKRYWEADNRAIQPSIDLLNLRAAYSAASDRWSVALWAKNVTDESYYTDVNTPRFSGLPYTIGWRSQPRTLGVDARLRF